MLNVRWTAPLAWSLLALSLALTLGGFVLSYFLASVDSSFEFTAALTLLPGQIAWPTVGALVARRRPENPIGWLFCAYGLGMGTALFTDPYGRYALLAPASPLPAGASLFVRLRRARGVERQQLKWIASTAALLAVAWGVGITLEAIRPRPQIADVFFFSAILALNLIPVAAGVAILRYRLYDIDT